MDLKWKECFQEWANTAIFKEKIELSIEIIENALKVSKRSYIAFSGGKDSLCVLHLISPKKPDITVIHWDFGRYYFPRTLFEEIQNIIIQFSIRDFRVYTSKSYEQLQRRAINILGREFLAQVVPQLKAEGFDLAFIGLRKEESSKRKVRTQKSQYLTEIPEIYPIADWTYLDVWAYIISRNLPYLSYYDSYGDIIGWDRVRLSTFFDPEFEKFGTANAQGVLDWRFKNIHIQYAKENQNSELPNI